MKITLSNPLICIKDLPIGNSFRFPNSPPDIVFMKMRNTNVDEIMYVDLRTGVFWKEGRTDIKIIPVDAEIVVKFSQ